MDQYHTNKYTPAIYTHCYDTSGTRLFAAGGPLQNCQMVRQGYLIIYPHRGERKKFIQFYFFSRSLVLQS